jgi:ABC-type glycerol-3-phosphate transport system substrate-binding protein
LDEEPAFNVGVAPYPLPVEDGELPVWSSERGFFISRQTENVQACWTWIKYLTEQPDVYQGVPARRSVVESPEWEALVGKEAAEIYKLAIARVDRALEQDDYSPISWPFYQWRSDIILAVLGGQDPVKVLAEAQVIADTYLACIAGFDAEKLSGEEIFEQVRVCAKQADPEGSW